jgi:ubiquinone/menaquinone biosynthesis C-methylase UbiE
MATSWDAAADGWDRHGPLVRAWLRDATDAMLDAAGVRSGARVLDVAAGAGDQTLDIARRAGPHGEVLATDLSPVILGHAQARMAQARAAGEPLAPVRTAVADAQALALAGAGFDAAVCRLGLMFCPDPGAALRAVRAALAPGGRFAALVFAGPAGNPCITTLVQTALELAGAPPGDPFAPGTLLSLGRPAHLQRLMAESGFDAVSVRTLDAPMRTSGVAEYVNFVRSAGSPVIRLIDALPPARRDAAWAEIASRLARFEVGNGWVGPNELLLVAGA